MVFAEKRVVVAAALAVFGVFAHAQSQLYVSTSGNDAWSGTLPSVNASKTDGPKRTLLGARQAVRGIQAKGYPAAGVVVNIAAGTYSASDRFELDPNDGGTPSAPVIYRGAGASSTILSGGYAITNWKKAPTTGTRIPASVVGKVLVADLSALRIPALSSWGRKGFPLTTDTYQAELYYGGSRQTLAQFPNSGWLSNSTSDATGVNLLSPLLRSKSWQINSDVRAYGYFGCNWADSYENVKSLNASTGAVQLATSSYYGVSRTARFKFVNVLEELDSPGEYFIDYAKQVIYYYPVDATMTKQAVLASNRDDIVGLYGVNNVRFENMTFSEGARHGLYAGGCNNITVQGCMFNNLNQVGVFTTKVSNFNVVSCDFTNLGEVGVSLDSGDRATLTSGHSSVVNCYFNRYGQVARANHAGVQLTGVGSYVANNRFVDAPHQAIYLQGNNHIVEKNQISNVCNDTDDAGAIYMDKNMSEYGNVIRYNIIQDLKQRTGGNPLDRVVGIYLDDFTSGTQVYGNIMHRVDVGVMIGGGRDNVVTDNVFDTATNGLQIDARGTTWASSFITSGLYQRPMADINPNSAAWLSAYPQVANLRNDNPASPKRNLVDRNVTVGVSFVNAFDNMTIQPNANVAYAGYNNYTGFVNNFVNLATNDIRTLPNSPANNFGFKSFDASTVGLSATNGRTTVTAF